MGLSKHGGVVVGIAGGQNVKVQGFQCRHRVFLLILHPHVVAHDAAGFIDLQLIAEERRKSQLAHQRMGELIERIGQDNRLTSFAEPGDKVDGAFQWTHLVDDTLDIVKGELVLIQDSQAPCHQGIVIRHLAGGDFQFLDAGLQCNVDPDLRHQHAFEVQADDDGFLHAHVSCEFCPIPVR